MNKKFVYLYDESFVNLLSLIKYLLEKRVVPLNIKNSDYQPNLFEEVIELNVIDNEEAIAWFIKYFGINIFNVCFSLFLSADENKELLIYYFFAYAIKYKNRIFYMRNMKAVDKALKIYKYVNHEAHKFKGFLRFKELKNNVLYAEIEPTNNIIFLLAKHFKDRLSNEYWIIKDVKRGILCIFDKVEFYFVGENNFNLFTNECSLDEELIQEMWKDFYKTIGIKERKNDKCRMNFMPKKYWKYILEVGDEYEKSN